MNDFGDRVIEGRYEGSAYPIEDVDFERAVVLGQRFHVDGGLYAKRLKVVGRGEVRGPIFVGSEAVMEGIGSSLIARSGLMSRQSIKIDESGDPVAESTVAKAGKERLLSGGDITAEYVFLENSLVVGAVRGKKRVRLKNCIVIGPVFCRGEVHLTNCTLLTYNAESIAFEGRNTCLLPMGFSKEKPVFGSPREGDPAIESWLRYIALCEGMNSASDYVSGALRHDPENDLIDKEDLLRVCIDPDADLQQGELEEWGSGWGLNLSARALNWGPISDSVEDISAALRVFYSWENLSEPLRVKFISEIAGNDQIPSFIKEVALAVDERFGAISKQEAGQV